jgi:predicted nucleic acid-binding protein
VKLFVDSSVLLAASESPLSASREFFQRARSNDWTLLTAPHVLHEVTRNLQALSPQGAYDWNVLRQQLVVIRDMEVLNWPVTSAKNNPVLFSALASAEALLTLDEELFGSMMQTTFYGLVILRPGVFLQQQRASGRLH